MTDDTAENAAPAATPAETTSTAAPLSGKSKAFWAGVGIGSAAILAAVMYARRPKKKK